MTETRKESRFILVDSDDDDEQGLVRMRMDEQDEDRNGKDKGKEIADGDDTAGFETPAVSLGGPSKRASSGAAPAAKRWSQFLFSK